MARYSMKFSKEGYICYISHLDMLRLFKRAFKKAAIPFVYSQGFNPHPKLGFAQPLSLGYSSIGEYLEFEIADALSPGDILERLRPFMPEGIKLSGCVDLPGEGKSLAALTAQAEYIVGIPLPEGFEGDANQLCTDFLEQTEILVSKKQKKKKVPIEINIRERIQALNFVIVNNNLILTTLLDCGSDQNLSPELLIKALKRFLNITTDRSEIDVMRTKIKFTNNFQI